IRNADFVWCVHDPIAQLAAICLVSDGTGRDLSSPRLRPIQHDVRIWVCGSGDGIPLHCWELLWMVQYRAEQSGALQLCVAVMPPTLQVLARRGESAGILAEASACSEHGETRDCGR